MKYEATTHIVRAADQTQIAWHAHRAPTNVGAERAAPAVLLTNGLSTTDNFWKHLVAHLAPTCHVAHWNYRGHAPSASATAGDYSIRAHVADLERVTEAFARETGSAAVHIGFSMGVTVLLELYRRRPELVRAMVLIAGGAEHPYASSSFFRVPGARPFMHAVLGAVAPLVPWSAPIARKVTASRFIFSLSQRVGAIGREAPRDDVEHFYRSVGEMDLVAYWETLRSLMHARASDVVPTVRVPALVIAPEVDVMALRGDLDALIARLPGAESMRVEGTTHAILLEAGDRVGARARAFIAGLP